MKPIDLACGMCAAQPGEPCVNVDGTLFVIFGAQSYHSDRIEAAAAQVHEGEPLTDEAVARTGVV